MREKSRSWDLMIWRVFSTATDLLGTHHLLQRCPPQKTSNSQRKKRTMDDHNVLTVALRKPCPNVQTKAVDSVLIGEFNIYDGDWSFLLFNNQKINDPNRKMQKGRAPFLFSVWCTPCILYGWFNWIFCSQYHEFSHWQKPIHDITDRFLFFLFSSVLYRNRGRTNLAADSVVGWVAKTGLSL